MATLEPGVDTHDHMPATASTTAARYTKLTGIALAAHLGVTLVHLLTHVQSGVFLGQEPTIVVLVTNYVLPVLALVLLWRGAVTLGAVIGTLALAGSFVLGLSLHFLLATPDNVASVPLGPWQLPFQATAVTLAGIDGLGGIPGAMLLWTLQGHRDDGLPQTGRITGVPGSGFRPFTRLSYWFSRRWVGDVPESLTVTAHHGSILAGTNAFEVALDRAGLVDDRLKELAVLKAAMLIGCEFCIDIGSAEASKLGVTEAQLRSLRRFEESDAFSERERLVLRYAVAMTVTPTDVPDDLFEDLYRTFDEAELVELTAAIAYENYRGRFNHAFGMQAQGFAEDGFCPRPETASRASSMHGPETR